MVNPFLWVPVRRCHRGLDHHRAGDIGMEIGMMLALEVLQGTATISTTTTTTTTATTTAISSTTHINNTSNDTDEAENNAGVDPTDDLSVRMCTERILLSCILVVLLCSVRLSPFPCWVPLGVAFPFLSVAKNAHTHTHGTQKRPPCLCSLPFAGLASCARHNTTRAQSPSEREKKAGPSRAHFCILILPFLSSTHTDNGAFPGLPENGL